MHSIILVTLIVLGQRAEPSGSPLDANQFLRVIQGLHSDYHDVSFIYEGDYIALTYLPVLGIEQQTLQTSYQGNFAYRSDGSALVDRYSHAGDDPTGEVLRRTLAIGPGFQKNFSGHLGHGPERITESEVPDLRAISQAMMPGRFFYLWYFDKELDLSKTEYRFLGWVEIDGRNCLSVEFRPLEDIPGSIDRTRRFWIDLERGGQPLRVEELDGETLCHRIDGIRLEQFPTSDGKSLWLPIEARSQQFIDAATDTPLDRPNFRQTYFVSTGSVKLNSGLSDSVFQVFWEGGLAQNEQLKAFRSRADVDAATRIPTDHASVQRRLDEMLADADEQSARIEASSPARSFWNSTTILQVGFLGIGAALIVFIIYWTWGRR